MYIFCFIQKIPGFCSACITSIWKSSDSKKLRRKSNKRRIALIDIEQSKRTCLRPINIHEEFSGGRAKAEHQFLHSNRNRMNFNASPAIAVINVSH